MGAEGPSKRPHVRVGIRTLVSLALCAAAAGAAMAHFAIDVIGDYALSRDSYDHLRHGSREVVTGLALMLAALLVARGLRICAEIAAANCKRLLRPAVRVREALGALAGTVALSVTIVPAMEYLDGRLDGEPVQRLGDAFGGSIPLGLGATVLSATLVALIVYGIARWLLSHCDSVVATITILLRRSTGGIRPSAYQLVAQRVTPRRRRAPDALRLSKRGPPATSFA
jgi:hypothetical protein